MIKMYTYLSETHLNLPWIFPAVWYPDLEWENSAWIKQKIFWKSYQRD